ncbi:MAG: hypothetical protein HYT70_01140 [Candidatus Aenigmarchaeota archaeon]|nr:hypothetical protein [Candidatus Aenigmarchaeota archaeon]
MGVKQLAEKPVRDKANEYDENLKQMIEQRRTSIKVVGCGGSGGNTVTRLMQVGITGAETVALNTDAVDLLNTEADKKLVIGKELTQGLGAGANPNVGMESAKESKDEIKKLLQGADMVFIACGLGGGCLRGSSTIYTNPQGPVRIDSINTGSFVYSLEEGKLVKKPVVAAMKTGIKKVYEVRTRNNSLVASYDHPFLKVVPKITDKRGRFSRFSFEWVGAEELKPNDLVVILRKAPELDEPNLEIEDGFYATQSFCRLFGFLLGDGWVSRSKDSWKIHFSPSKDEERNNRYISLVKEIFGLEMKRHDNWYYANSKRVYELLWKLGLDRHAKEKEIPSWLFKLPDSYKKEFILGLADADGHYYRQRKSNGKEKIELRFEMSSKKLIRQLKVLCDYLGLRSSNISSRTREVKPPNSKQKLISTSWEVRVYKLYQLNKSLEKSRERDGIGFLYGYRGTIRPEFFKHFGFTRVKSVKYLGEEDVYDITVDGSHNFVAEGFLVHNTGTGSAPVVAEIAKKVGALTVAIVTMPFSMEGKSRSNNALEGLRNLENVVDTLIVIPNDKLLEIVPDVSITTAFKVCDEILVNAVKGITELVTKPGLVNLDFADVRTIMRESGLAMIGLGESNSENRAFESVERALNNPLLSVDINGAVGALINVAGGPEITIREAQQIADAVSSKLSPDARIIWGVQVDKSMGENVRTMLVITGVNTQQVPGKDGVRKKRDIEKFLGIEFVE